MTTAYDISRKELHDCSAGEPLHKVADTLQRNKISSILVKNHRREHVGLITVGDILRLVADKEDLSKTAGEVMSPLKAVTPKEVSVESLRHLFKHENLTRIPLADKDGKIVGIVRDKDIERLRNFEQATDYIRRTRYQRF